LKFSFRLLQELLVFQNLYQLKKKKDDIYSLGNSICGQTLE